MTNGPTVELVLDLKYHLGSEYPNKKLFLYILRFVRIFCEILVNVVK